MNRRHIITAALAGPLAATAASPDQAAPVRRASPRERQILTKDGVSLFHRDWGEGRPVVFLSAWGFSSEAWQYQMLPLSRQGLRCVTYDRRGHGRTADPSRGYDFDTLADDLAQVLEALDLRDVVLVAYSMGSGEAVRYLSRHGHGRVAKVLFVAPVTPFLSKTSDNPDGVDPAVFARNRTVMAKDFPAALAAGFPTFIDTGASEELKTWCKGIMLQCSLKALIDCQEAFSATDFRAELKRFPVPAMVIHGDADRSAIPALTGKKTAALIRGCELRLYPGAPHGLVFTHTERLNADIAAFAKA